MKRFCTIVSWCFTCFAMALLSLLVGSFVLTAKLNAQSSANNRVGNSCYQCQGSAINPSIPGACRTLPFLPQYGQCALGCNSLLDNGVRCP